MHPRVDTIRNRFDFWKFRHDLHRVIEAWRPPADKARMKRSTHLLTFALLIVLSLLAPLTCMAQGAPPFRTEDPETPGNHRLEINFGAAGNRNLSDGDYDLPSLDLAYGL